MHAILRYYVFGQWHISLCATALYAGGGTLLCDDIPSIASLVFIFSATFITYQIHRLASQYFYNAAQQRHRFISRPASWRGLIPVSVMLIWSLPYLQPSMITALVGLGIICLAYTMPIIYRKRLRDIGALKIALIALVWSFLPILWCMDQMEFSASLLIVAEHFFFIVALTIPFDIRDKDLDSATKVSNLTAFYPLSYLRRLMYGSMMISISMVFFLHVTGIYDWLTTSLMIVFYVGLYMSTRGWEEAREEWYYLFYLDGLILVKGLLLLVANGY